MAWDHIETCLVRLDVWNKELATEFNAESKTHCYRTMQFLRDLGKRIGMVVALGLVV